MRSLLATLAFLAMAIAAAPRADAAPGDVPALWTQTGRLFDNAGAPVVGDIAMEFALYDLPSGGTALWTEAHTVTLDDGYFIVGLGGTVALPALDGTPRYLGIKVGADPEMTPREELVSVPYSL